jgi:hypothetical protein
LYLRKVVQEVKYEIVDRRVRTVWV